MFSQKVRLSTHSIFFKWNYENNTFDYTVHILYMPIQWLLGQREQFGPMDLKSLKFDCSKFLFIFTQQI